MTAPQRIQRQRTKGWRTPLCSCGCGKPAVYVGRPTKWGNPFRVYRCACCGYWDVKDDNGVTYLIDHDYSRRHPQHPNPRGEALTKAVQLYRDDFAWCSAVTPLDVRASLAGHDLMCWCPLDQPCHADVLLSLANTPTSASADDERTTE